MKHHHSSDHDETWWNRYARERIREARKKSGMSQEQLGERIGKSQSFVGQLEAGTIRLELNTLFHIAKVLRKPFQYFFPDTEPIDLARRELYALMDELTLDDLMEFKATALAKIGMRENAPKDGSDRRALKSAGRV